MEINLEDLHRKEQEFLQSQTPKVYAKGRSIVTTCYDKELASTWVLLNELNRLKCELPVEIFHRPGELTSEQIALLESVNPDLIKIKTITGQPKDFISRYGHKHGWACKIYALYESTYAENLWIDADNCPIRNPEFLFDDTEYLAKGSLFWRDMLSPDSADQYSSNSSMWPIFNVPVNDGEPFESGQLVLNKNTCWIEFALVKYYADNCEIYYNFGGDKETFKLAWQRIGHLKGHRALRINYHSDSNIPFGFMPYGPFSKGVTNQYGKWGGGSVMVQRDRNGDELFNHRNLSRFTLDDNKYLDILNENHYHNWLSKLNNIYKI